MSQVTSSGAELLAVGCQTPCICRYNLESNDMSGRKLLLESAKQHTLGLTTQTYFNECSPWGVRMAWLSRVQASIVLHTITSLTGS